jgi:hypothetical protein
MISDEMYEKCLKAIEDHFENLTQEELDQNLIKNGILDVEDIYNYCDDEPYCLNHNKHNRNVEYSINTSKFNNWGEWTRWKQINLAA